MGEGVNTREGPSESCHWTPEPIWVTGLMEANDAALPPYIPQISSLQG